MSIRTAAYHCPSELVFISADEINNVVTFVAPSKSKLGTVNIVKLDLQTGDILCSCKAAECHRECWHATLVVAAWLNHPSVQGARRLGGEQLERFGKKLAQMCKVYRARIGRPLPADAVGLLAARTVYRERLVRAAGSPALAPLVTMPVVETLQVAA
jgi:hypothetical protein